MRKPALSDVVPKVIDGLYRNDEEKSGLIACRGGKSVVGSSGGPPNAEQILPMLTQRGSLEPDGDD